MILGARFLTKVSNVNEFDYVQHLEFMEGDEQTFHIQLVDVTQDLDAQGFKPSGKRFVPPSGAALRVIVEVIDDGQKVERFCTNPFPEDRSIFRLEILSSDKLKAGTANLRLILTESDGSTRRGYVQGAFRIQSPTALLAGDDGELPEF